MKEKLIEAAKDAMKHAYVPYSRFPVGVALVTKEGAIFKGCNIENAAYSVCNCAERTALFKAYSEGEKAFAALAVVANSDRPISPCGACRQVMSELCDPDMPVYLANLKGDVIETVVRQLLPNAFSGKDLGQ